MNEIKVILLCSSRFAIPTLRQLFFFNQLGVVAIPAHCEEMIEQTREVLKGSPIPIIVLNKAGFAEQLTTAIEEYGINTGLILTFSYIIPPSVYQSPSLGFFNVHPALLPAYRGADPVFQQIKNRERNTGVTIHKVEEAPDTGAIVIQEMIPLESDDTYGMLTEKLSQLSAKLVSVVIKLAGYGFSVPAKLQDESKASYFKRQGASDISIDWDVMDAGSIIALINACNPWNKGAVTRINNKIIRLLEAEETEHSEDMQVPGGVILSIDEDGMVISSTGGEAIKVGIVFMDEGFFNSSRLKQFGMITGMQFEKV
jgi:methionyl-tRNA formyltransferase